MADINSDLWEKSKNCWFISLRSVFISCNSDFFSSNYENYEIKHFFLSPVAKQASVY